MFQWASQPSRFPPSNAIMFRPSSPVWDEGLCLLLLIILTDFWLAHGVNPLDFAVSATILSKLTWQVSQKSKTWLFKLVARKKAE